jgi:hypothetical protein
MQWIDEMFVNMQKERSAASAKKSEKAAEVDRPEHLKKQIPGTLKAWNSLVSSITKDVNEFNNPFCSKTQFGNWQRHLLASTHGMEAAILSGATRCGHGLLA